MLYRVQANLLFDDSDEAADAYHDLELALGKAITVNPGHATEEHSVISWHNCPHSDPNIVPCNLIDEQQSP